MTTEHRYQVVVEHVLVYAVEAETPEDAAALIEQGDDLNQPIDVVSVSVTAVVAGDGNWSDDDLRAPAPCRGGCGKTLPASSSHECTPCFLDRLDRLYHLTPRTRSVFS